MKKLKKNLKMSLTNIGQDTSICVNSNRIILSVHTSNKEESFIQQWREIMSRVDEFPDHEIIVIGDYNVITTVESDYNLCFWNKDEPSISIASFTCNRRVTTSQVPSTTCKERCLSSQLHKIFNESLGAIDCCVIFSPVGQDSIENLTLAFYNDEVVTIPETFAPLDWPSDHALIGTLRDEDLIFSMNMFGESVDGEIFNIYEMFTKACIDKIRADPALMQEFYRIKEEFGNEVYGGFRIHDIWDSETKYFSKVTRKVAIAGSVFLPPASNRIDTTTPFYRALYNYYQKCQGQLESLPEDSEERIGTERLLTFYSRCINSPILKEFFVDWYLELEQTPKMNFMQVIEGIINGSGLGAAISEKFSKNFNRPVNSRPLAFCIQELSMGMMNSINQNRDLIASYGYMFDFPEQFAIPGAKNKTRGLIIYRND